MSESKLPNLIIGLTVDSTGIDAGLNRAKSKISRFGGGSGGGVNSGVNNGTGGWGPGGGNDVGGAVLGAALGSSLGNGAASRWVDKARLERQMKVGREYADRFPNAPLLGKLRGSRMSDKSIARAKNIVNSVEQPTTTDLGELYNYRNFEQKRAAVNYKSEKMMMRNRQQFGLHRMTTGAIATARTKIEESFVGRTMGALGMSSRLGPLAIAGTAFAIGSKIANYKKDELARTADLTRFKGTADYGKYQQMKYDYISKPRIEDQRSMGASAVSKSGAGGQTATDKLMDAGATTLGAMGYVAGAAFENFSQLFYQPSDNIKVALDIIDRRKNSI